MDVFSLEEEEGGFLFLTQQSKKDEELEAMEESCGEEDFLGLDVMDFQSPCVSVVREKGYQPDFSDISDDDFDTKGQDDQQNFV